LTKVASDEIVSGIVHGRVTGPVAGYSEDRDHFFEAFNDEALP